MASTAIGSALIYTSAYAFFSGVNKGFWALLHGFLYRYQLCGVVISPAGGKSFLINNLKSNDTFFVDLDKEIWDAFDDEEKELSKIKHVNLPFNRVMYLKAKEISKEIVEMINGTTKSVKKIVFLSADFRMLKYIGVPRLYYTIGTKSYYETLDIPEEKQKLLEHYQEDIKEFKESKLVPYDSLSALISFITAITNAKVRI